MDAYIPGRFNLGLRRRARRLTLGLLLLLASLLLAYLLPGPGAPRAYGMLLFPPLFFALLFLQEGLLGFGVMRAMAGDPDPDLEGRVAVEGDPVVRDRRKANLLLMTATAVSLGAAAWRMQS
ncbi:MAG: hypothetical protein HY558_02695 [Euryarchaeota archaeon]|nr:hypothetical protein [Euryarchaeota archaeon]